MKLVKGDTVEVVLTNCIQRAKVGLHSATFPDTNEKSYSRWTRYLLITNFERFKKQNDKILQAKF